MSVEDGGLRIEVLPASFGDCLLVTASDSFIMVVDSGPGRSTVRRLKERLRALPKRDGACVIDLFVITHIDSDHIAGAKEVLEDTSLRFHDVWFNGRDEVVRTRGVAQADTVSATLDRLGLPHNRAFGGGPVVVPPGAHPWCSVDLGPGRPRITLLSPTPAGIDSLASQWSDVVRRLDAGEPDSAAGETLRGGRPERPPIDLERLSSVPYEEDGSIPNASSIVLLVEFAGRSLLLAADGVSSVYGRALATLMTSRDPSRRSVDVVKLAHHGSRRNTERQLALLGADHYLVSSNNKRYGLPDDETIARLVVGNRRHPTFWFNYATPANLRWQDVAAIHRTFSVRYPDSQHGGIVLELPPREPRG